MNSTETSSECAWARFGDYGADETMIVGNREGLIELRNAIDHAIECGEVSISNGGIEFNGIRRVDGPHETWSESSGYSLAGIGCLLLLVTCFLIFVFGVVELFRQLL